MMLPTFNRHVQPGTVAVSADNLFRFITDRTKFATGSFYVNDLDIVKTQYERWQQLLPRVTPHYAVKCSPDLVLMSQLANLGSGFDCASRGELEMALKINGGDADSIIFAHPIKKIPDLMYARGRGVKKMTFDGKDELYKIAEHYPDADLVLRLLPDGSRSLMDFGSKFGADVACVGDLLATAKDLNLNVVGTSFHVGSGCLDTNAYVSALTLSRDVFDVGATMGFSFDLLDIGGGFPGGLPPDSVHRSHALRNTPVSMSPHLLPTMEEIGAVVRPAIDRLFPSDIKIISEPGRYFASAWATLACQIVGRREISHDGHTEFLYFVDDGVYGSFNCQVFDHAAPAPLLLQRLAMLESSMAVLESSMLDRRVVSPPPAMPASLNTVSLRSASTVSGSVPPSFTSTLFGPTCDSMDVIVKGVPMPLMEVGEWLCFAEMGAYTKSAGCSFNGFDLPSDVYINMSDECL